MQAPGIPGNEARRLRVLEDLQLVDTPSESVYDNVTSLASDLFDVPIALLSIVDSDRQWFKSRVGLEATETGRDISFCGHVVCSGSPLVVNDARQDPRFATNPLVTGPPHIRFYAGMPILLEKDTCIGTLCIIDAQPRSLGATELQRLGRLRNVIQEILRRTRDATIDPLTGAFNRRMCETIGEKMLATAARTGSSVSAVCIDIDHFKVVNDRHGHDAGDALLRAFAEFIREQVREQDYLFRVGGEEFVFLMPGTTASHAVQVCERLRRGLRDLVVRSRNAEISVTSSFGVAQYQCGREDLGSLLARADVALYQAKNGGRNRTVKAGELPPVSVNRRLEHFASSFGVGAGGVGCSSRDGISVCLGNGRGG